MKISENTPVTIGLVVVIVTGVVWISSVYFIATSALTLAKEVSLEQREYQISVTELKTDVKWIKRKLGGGEE